MVHKREGEAWEHYVECCLMQLPPRAIRALNCLGIRTKDELKAIPYLNLSLIKLRGIGKETRAKLLEWAEIDDYEDHLEAIKRVHVLLERLGIDCSEAYFEEPDEYEEEVWVDGDWHLKKFNSRSYEIRGNIMTPSTKFVRTEVVGMASDLYAQDIVDAHNTIVKKLRENHK